MGSMASVGAGIRGLTSIVSGVAPLFNMGAQITRDVRTMTGQSQQQAQYAALQNLQARQSLAMQQLIAQQQTALNQAGQDAALAQEQIGINAQDAERTRRAALKRAVARQRVSLASQGISSADDGSSEAILLGLFQESEDERQTRGRLDGLRQAALTQDLSQRQTLNVLQRAQLAERQQLEQALLA